MQARLGVREVMERAGRHLVRDAMPDEHRDFLAALRFVVVGGLDAGDRPWASLLVGPPGFVRTPDARTVEIGATPSATDPLAAALRPGDPIGLLGIDLATRRRNRVNGRIVARDAAGLRVRVDQSYGNCPQYIQARALAPPDGARAAAVEARAGGAVGACAARVGDGARTMGQVGDAARALIRGADTLFIATASAAARGDDPRQGVDVSHRGGRPGFVRIGAERDVTVLTMPDFAGNRVFNTLGNIAVNPRAGLLFLDFAAGALLWLSGAAAIVWDGPEVRAFRGAERLVRVRVERCVFAPGNLSLRWGPPQPARQLERTGTWDDVAPDASATGAK